MSRLNCAGLFKNNPDVLDQPIPQEAWDKLDKKMEERKSHNKFMKEVDKAKSVPAQTHNALNEESQSKSDIAAIKRSDANCEGAENE